ncbi:hypothetical protein BKA93DRAFT_929437 [Sparassis latifolia]
MPTFSSRSTIRETAGNFTLSLGARHIFAVGSPSEEVYNAKGLLPEDVDIILGSNLVFSLSGVLGSARVAANGVQHSAIVHQFLSHLKTNSSQLGLSTVSDVYIDEDDGLPKFTAASSRPMPSGRRPPTVRLVAIDLVFEWKSTVSDEAKGADDVDPFAARAYLPIMSALDRLVDTFVCWHLVRRYPLIFGPWRNMLDLECSFFPVVLRSITHMAQRSSNPLFRKRFTRLMTTLETQIVSSSASSIAALHGYLGHPPDESDKAEHGIDTAVDSDYDVLSLSLERLFRQEIRPARFKGCGTVSGVVHADENDDAVFNLSQDLLDDAGDDDYILGSEQVLDYSQVELDIDDWQDFPGDDPLLFGRFDEDSPTPSSSPDHDDFMPSSSESEIYTHTPHTHAASVDGLRTTELCSSHSQKVFLVSTSADTLSHDNLHGEELGLGFLGAGDGLTLSHDPAADYWSFSAANDVDIFYSRPSSPESCRSFRNNCAGPREVDSVDCPDSLARQDCLNMSPTRASHSQASDVVFNGAEDGCILDLDWDIPDLDSSSRSSDDGHQPSADDFREASHTHTGSHLTDCYVLSGIDRATSHVATFCCSRPSSSSLIAVIGSAIDPEELEDKEEVEEGDILVVD